MDSESCGWIMNFTMLVCLIILFCFTVLMLQLLFKIWRDYYGIVLELFIKCSSRDVCREGKICQVALDYRDCYFVDLRRSKLLEWYWGRTKAKAFRFSWSTTGMTLKLCSLFHKQFSVSFGCWNKYLKPRYLIGHIFCKCNIESLKDQSNDISQEAFSLDDKNLASFWQFF
jgi:hypothetical protein